MSFVDHSSGWRWPALAASVAAQVALIAAAGAAFHASQTKEGTRDAMVVAVFQTPAPPRPAPPPPPERSGQRAEPAPHRAELPSVMPDNGPDLAALTLLPREPGGAAPAEIASIPAQPQRVEVAAAPPAEEAATRQALLAAYKQQVRAMILARRPRGETRHGVVTLSLRLDLSGRLTDSAVSGSSGDIRLDRTALRMLRQAAPFPKPSEGLQQEDLSFWIDVRFH